MCSEVKHHCDWCKEPAKYQTEVKKNKRTGLIGTGIKWYACKDPHHKELLEEFAKNSYGNVVLYP